MSVLVILAHPNLSTQSRVNQALKAALEPTSVAISDLYAPRLQLMSNAR
ncbi:MULTISPECIES: NAD(P)H-dependent oxidoreductase [unclassified Helicobacter]|nr:MULTISPECIES: NAD(P)H-dependent oxidoreductase [unclassified Helicobacter]